MDIGSCRRDTDDVLLDELESNIVKFVRINDDQDTHTFDGGDDSDIELGSEKLEPFGSEPIKNCATFPSPGKKLSSQEDDEIETALRIMFSEELHLCSTYLPLVSAMKGSREKQGAAPRKLSVSWAPDVYDPIPNSQSHTVKSRQKKSRKDKDRYNNNNYKKNGKKGQKGNSSRSGTGKKQFHKLGGRSDKCYRTLDAGVRQVAIDPSDGLGDFGVGSPDYCGSSFLKKNVPQFHYSFAEAL